MGSHFYPTCQILACKLKEDWYTPSLVQKIADTFGLNKNDVQSVFDKFRLEKRSQMDAKLEEKLSQLVKEGKITELQKKLILDKRKELEVNRPTKESMKNLTPDQRKAQIQAKKTELQDWAKQNNIDLRYLFPAFGMRGFRHMK